MKTSYYLDKNELNKLKFKFIGNNCKISSLASFIETKNISINDNVRIDDFVLLVAKKGFIKIGANTHIGSHSYIQGWSGVLISSNCNISQGVRIYSKSDDYKRIRSYQIKKKVIIRENVIIGSNSVILPGATIEKNSRIGALTIVNKKISKNQLFYGNKIINIY
jgi:acetyltransferase-like isoleucine patch superfamily enzyme